LENLQNFFWRRLKKLAPMLRVGEDKSKVRKQSEPWQADAGTHPPSISRGGASLPSLSQYDQPLTEAQRAEFSGYLHEPTGKKMSESTQRNLFEKSIDCITQQVDRLKRDLGRSLLTRSDEMTLHDNVLSTFQSFHRMNLNPLRKQAVILLKLHSTKGRMERLKTHLLQTAIERAVLFIEFLRDLTVTPLPAVDVNRFRETLELRSPELNLLNVRIRRLETACKPLQEPKIGSGGWYYSIIHPKSKGGKILARYEQRISELRYEEVYGILDHLSPADADFKRTEDLMFDLAWQQMQYPFGMVMKLTLPLSGDFFPPVMGPTVLDADYGYFTFSELHCMEWPFKASVGLLFEMMLLTNPFDIGRTFWSVTQEVANAMRQMMAKEGENPDEVEIDFDSLFPVVMVCVFVLGLDEWLHVASYAMSFSEHASADPEVQFAFTYLEGLITQIVAIDVDAARKTADSLRQGKPS
jgi:hypothetical protein